MTGDLRERVTTMTPEDRAGEIVLQHLGQTVGQAVVTIARAIREAEERGKQAERERTDSDMAVQILTRAITDMMQRPADVVTISANVIRDELVQGALQRLVSKND